MAKSHIQLRRLYNAYNKKYFNSKLPTDIEIIWAPCDDSNGKFDYNNGKPRIRIDPSLQGQPKFTKIIMGHECIHAFKPKASHGSVFDKEIERLFKVGFYKGLL